jgi:hypothetical protein
MHIVDLNDNRSNRPPLGDMPTKTLPQLLVNYWMMGALPECLTTRGASLNDVRRETRQRETRGVGVGR